LKAEFASTIGDLISDNDRPRLLTTLLGSKLFLKLLIANEKWAIDEKL
jgi:hypothetical protein